MTQELPERHEPENGHFFIEDLDAEAFATWLREAYERSRFKTLTELAAAVGSNKATISRLMSGAPQTLTGRPSKPRSGLVLELARVLGADENAGMFYAGHPVYGRPYKKPTNLQELLAALEDLGLDQFAFSLGDSDLSKFDANDFEEVLDRIKADVEITIKRKK
jgi:hypothetical protein